MKKYILGLTCAFLTFSCVEDMNHDPINTSINNPSLDGKVELTFQELFNLHNNQIGKDTLVTGYVVSTDIEGNTYKEIYVQNTLTSSDIATNNPRMGLRVRLGLRSTGIKYAQGRKIAINLEGLKKTTTDNLLTIGAPDNNYIKDILEFDVDEHILKFDEVGEIEPKTTVISELLAQDLNTLVHIQNVQFSSYELGKPLANLPTDDYDGKRTLEFCSSFRKDTIILETSNFADFATENIPATKVNITAIYSISFDDEPILIVNKIEDLEQAGAYDECILNTPNVLITEIADPKNASFSRYVELYNNEDVDINLTGWNVNRYNNGNSESNVSLNNITIPAKGFVIIANKEESTDTNKNFYDSFGFLADLTHANIDGNGNDAYTLTNESGEVVDIFGVVTEDGTDTDWEYTDGRAYRNINIVTPNNNFTLDEWTIITDNQNAPDDFSPKERTATETEIIPNEDSVETANLIITEVADPKEDTKARFVEIYNPTNNNVSLKNWTLVRYNYTSTKNTKELAALPILLDELTIPANGFVIVSRDLINFNSYFGFTANIASTNLDGNGDDAYELIDPFDTIIDVYGDTTTDGSGYSWEYTDGYAQRNATITVPNSTFLISEWTIKEDVATATEFTPFQQ